MMLLIIYEKLKSKENSLDLNSTISNLKFVHHNQLLSQLVKPLQTIISRYIASSKPSTLKYLLSGGLEFLNTLQIIFHNTIPLALQGLQAASVKNIPSFINNFVNDIKQLKEELKSLNKSLQSSLIYSQLILKAIQYFPLNYIVSEKRLHHFEDFRSQSLFAVQLPIRAVTLGHSISQLTKLGVQSAYSSNYITSLCNGLFELACNSYDYYQS